MGFQLGLFSPNTESGLAITNAPERWHATWDDNLRLARLADEKGIDFLLPVARWTDWGPDTDFHRSALDPLVWASGLLAATSRIRVFSTVHTAFHHPVVAAKQLATADHLSKGRIGLNIVAGWHAPNTRVRAHPARRPRHAVRARAGMVGRRQTHLVGRRPR